MDVDTERDAARAAAAAGPLRSRVFAFFSFEVCMYMASAILFSAHLYLKTSDENLLEDGISVRGVIAQKSQAKKTANKGKDGYFYERTVRYRFIYHAREYTGSNLVNQNLWDRVHEGDPILLAVERDNPERSRIRSSDVVTGIIPALLLLSILPFLLGTISLIVSAIQKFRDRKQP